MSEKTIFQRSPLISYFVLTYIVSWGGSFVYAGQEILSGEPMELEAMMRLGIVTLLGPFLAGLVSTFLVDGAEGLRNLLYRFITWRVGLSWYAAALLTFPILILAVLLPLSAYSGSFRPNFVSFGILGGLLAGFLEETGWTGFAYPKMQAKFGALRGTLYLALLHGVWHVIPGILGYKAYGVFWLPRFIVMWMVAMVAMRVILVWIYASTGSLLLAQLTHASSTGFLLILGPSPMSPVNEILWWAIYAVVLWIVALIILLRTGKDFGKKSTVMAEKK
jgi:membrane protease YdiL (CAAX protease family)